jgi:hypothetical protein
LCSIILFAASIAIAELRRRINDAKAHEGNRVFDRIALAFGLLFPSLAFDTMIL